MENPSQVERETLLFASLLHDIGKLVQRASDEPTKHKHEEWGANWLQEAPLRPELLPPSIKEDVESLIYNHHSSAPIPRLAHLLEILQTADHLSAGERPEKEDSLQGEKGKWQREIPLRSLLSEVHLADKQQPSPSYWPLQPLTENPVFPQPREKAFATRANYQDILTKLNSKIKSIASVPALISLLEELLTFVPSETREVLAEGGEVIGEKDPDISLYDHLKLSCAIALSLYDSQDKGFLLAGGDLSGVQNFIYTITSKGALKTLRARSFYVELLTSYVVSLLLEELSLPPTNIIFLGGARFTLLLPDSPSAEEKLRNCENQVNDWLWRKFAGRLYLALKSVPLSKEELKGKGLVKKQEELRRILEREKLAKFASHSEQLFQPREIKGVRCEKCGEIIYECDVCQAKEEKYYEVEDFHLCPLCHTLHEMGGELPRLKCLFEHPAGEIELPQARYKVSPKLEGIPQSGRVFLINVGAEEAPTNPQINFLPLASYVKRDEEGKVYDFDAFAQHSRGAELVGFLRMDVDNLGRIFSEGLGEYSFSRLATLSRFLSLFFKRYIDGIVKDRNVAVVYSGGDDLFIVGSWDDVLECSFLIRDNFSQFTKNPSFTISAGFLASDPKMPLYQLARESGEFEESAKGKGGSKDKAKDRLAFFFLKKDEPTWDVAKKIREWKEGFLRDFAEMKDGHYELKLPRSLLYRLLRVSEDWERKGGEEWEDSKRLSSYIYLIYIVGKIRESLKNRKDLREKWEDFYKRVLLNEENIPHFAHFVYWIDLLLREKGGAS